MTVAGADTNAAPSRLKTNGSHHASDVAVSKRDLTSWWRQFKRGNVKREGEKGDLRSAAIHIGFMFCISHGGAWKVLYRLVVSSIVVSLTRYILDLSVGCTHLIPEIVLKRFASFFIEVC